MPDPATLTVFFGAALVLAAMPGPGLFYVAGRTLASGRADGLASCLGTAFGGCVHVLAGAAGVSALVVASATAFTALKLAGGLYLIYLGVQTWRSAAVPILAPGDTAAPDAIAEGDPSRRAKRRRAFRGRAFRQGAVVEATNPKTAAFFLALIPQFIDVSRGGVASQFVVLGLVSVALNTGMAVLVGSSARRLGGLGAARATGGQSARRAPPAARLRRRPRRPRRLVAARPPSGIARLARRRRSRPRVGGPRRACGQRRP